MFLEKLKQTWDRLRTRWWTRRNQILLVGTGMLALVVVIGLLAARQMIQRGWPQAVGTLTVAGLRAPVTVVRDGYGVPHVYAESKADLFFAQGYVHAQDRFWQMELNRHRGRGILDRLLGDDARKIDRLWGGLNLVDVAERELAGMDDQTRAPLDTYAAGVNAWLETQRGKLPFEFALLGWRGRGIAEPVPWTAEDALIVSLVLSWQGSAPRVDPSLAARMVDRVGLARGEFLLAGKPDDPVEYANGIFPQTSNSPANALPDRWALGGRVTLVSGDLTESGKPLLGVDLPNDLALPAPWYVMAWHAGGERAAGASLPGVPGLLVGTDDGALWEAWSKTQDVALSAGVSPWKEWLLSALLTAREVVQLDDEPVIKTVDDLKTRLTDTFSPRAARLIPFLVRLEPQGWRQERVTGMLRKWDYNVGDNNKEAPFFVVYQLELARAVFADELGEDIFEAYVAQGDLYQASLDQLLHNPDDEWWDDVTTSERERQDDILKRAYELALLWIGRNYGDLHMLWEWDIVHSSPLRHPLGDTWPWDQLLSRNFAPDGWADTINASPGGVPRLCGGIQVGTEDSGICRGEEFFRAKATYGYRQVLDVSDPSTLWFVLLPGQSGHPFHTHYDDLMDEWLAGEYLPLRLAPSPEEVQGADTVLVLTPKD